MNEVLMRKRLRTPIIMLVLFSPIIIIAFFTISDWITPPTSDELQYFQTRQAEIDHSQKRMESIQTTTNCQLLQTHISELISENANSGCWSDWNCDFEDRQLRMAEEK